jgi:hypothetical protein
MQKPIHDASRDIKQQRNALSRDTYGVISWRGIHMGLSVGFSVA